MEGEVAIPIQNLDIPDQRREHKLVTYKQNYHGNQINILELDHHDSEQAGTEYKLPVNWREQLQTQIEATTGPIAPEYCMPDLERYLFNTNGPLGLFAKALLGGDNSETLMPDDDKSSTKTLIRL